MKGLRIGDIVVYDAEWNYEKGRMEAKKAKWIRKKTGKPAAPRSISWSISVCCAVIVGCCSSAGVRSRFVRGPSGKHGLLTDEEAASAGVPAGGIYTRNVVYDEVINA